MNNEILIKHTLTKKKSNLKWHELVVICLTILPYLRLAGETSYGYTRQLQNIDDIVRLLPILDLFFLLTLYFKTKININAVTISVVLFAIWSILITAIYHDYWLGWACMMISMLNTALFINYCVKMNNDALFSAYAMSLSYIAILLFVIIITNPDRALGSKSLMRAGYLFGHQNIIGSYTIPIMSIIIYSKNKQRQKYSLIDRISVICCVLSPFLTFSVTSLVGTAIFIILMVLSKKKRTVHMYIFFIISLLIFLLVILLRINLLLPLNPILGSLFNRDLSNFTGRTRIWGAAIAKIALNPIVGYGRNDSANQQLMGLNVTAPHSQYLDTLLYSGIIGLILLFSALILASLNEVKENRQHNIPLVNGIGSLLIMMQFESYDSYATFPLIIALVVLIGCKDVKKRYIQYGIN